jgi:hypothetical protein
MKEIASTIPSHTKIAATATPHAELTGGSLRAREGCNGRTMDSDRVAELQRWEDSGAVWSVVSRRNGRVTVALLRCDGGEEVDRFTSDDPRLLAYIGERFNSTD